MIEPEREMGHFYRAKVRHFYPALICSLYRIIVIGHARTSLGTPKTRTGTIH
jgi:hypothetical protein